MRELANALERAAILAEGDVVQGGDLRVSLPLPAAGGSGRTMVEIEREAIRRALEETDGNRRQAAQRLGIGERTLYDKLKRYGIGGAFPAAAHSRDRRSPALHDSDRRGPRPSRVLRTWKRTFRYPPGAQAPVAHRGFAVARGCGAPGLRHLVGRGQADAYPTGYQAADAGYQDLSRRYVQS